MFICPKCDEPIDQADIENGFCPHCGASFGDETVQDPSEEEE